MTKTMPWFVYAVRWLNPYNRPADWPVVLCEMVTDSNRLPAEIQSYPLTRGGGYGVVIQPLAPAMTRQLSQESLAKQRLKRLERRMRRKYPLLAEQFIAEAIAAKPQFYAGLTDAPLEEARQRLLAQEEARRLYLTEHWGELLVYAAEPEGCKARAAALLATIQPLTARRPSIPLPMVAG
jgi:hypothetical protein